MLPWKCWQFCFGFKQFAWLRKKSLIQAIYTLDSGKHVQIIIFNNLSANTIFFLETILMPISSSNVAAPLKSSCTFFFIWRGNWGTSYSNVTWLHRLTTFSLIILLSYSKYITLDTVFSKVKICILIYFLNCMSCIFVIIKYSVDLGTKLFLFPRVIL